MPRTLIGNFKGPQGEIGPEGLQGPQGLQGEKGDTGPEGKTAYEYALEGGFVGTEEEFAELLAQGGGLPDDALTFVQTLEPPSPIFPDETVLTGDAPPNAYALPGKAQSNGQDVALVGYVDQTYDMTDPEKPKRLDHLLLERTVYFATHAKAGAVHNLTAFPGASLIRFILTADYVSGDSWQLNGAPIALLYNNGMPAAPNTLKSGDLLVGEVTAGKVTLTIPPPESNPNLLDNWYFPDPINQKEQTEYGVNLPANSITIDRWHKRAAQEIVRIQDGYIEFEGTGNYQADIHQLLENPKRLVGKTLTFSVIAKGDGTNAPKIAISMGAEDVVYVPGTSSTDWQLLSGTFTANESTIMLLRCYASINTNVYPVIGVLAAKLELGDRQTLAHQDESGNWVLNDPPPNKQQELAKCQRYFQIFATQAVRPTALQDYRPPMRINPRLATIVIDGVTYYTADANL